MDCFVHEGAAMAVTSVVGTVTDVMQGTIHRKQVVSWKVTG